uniref:Uncharacterized protein n=1 Tax=Arundo donax TaxID=35708 RepID=A0A0A9CYU8_ARUDO
MRGILDFFSLCYFFLEQREYKTGEQFPSPNVASAYQPGSRAKGRQVLLQIMHCSCILYKDTWGSVLSHRITKPRPSQYPG